MKQYKIKYFAICLILSVILNVFMLDKTVVSADNSSEIVIDYESGRILYANNENQKRLIASTTKIATCITALENCDIEKQVTIKNEWCGIEGSSVYLKAGQKFTLEQLLHGLMLRSGNDCAVAIANTVSKNQSEFCDLMNQTAQKAGAQNSNFCNPHGLDDKEHFSTAKDLALITKYALKNKNFKKIVSTKKYEFNSGEQSFVWYNKNKLLANNEHAIGVKTGYTKKSGRCLVSAFNYNEQILICVLLNCPSTYERTEELIDCVREKYEYYPVFKCGECVATYTLENGSSLPCYVKQDMYYPLTNEEVDKLKYVVKFDEKIKKPVKFEQKVGTIQILLEKQLLFEQKIYTILE